MPIAEALVEIVLRPIFEIALYWTGYLVLKLLSFGKMRLAPLVSLYEKNISRR